MRIEETINAAAEATPDTIALRFGQRSWTYRQLREERDRRAGVLVGAGLRVGDRVVSAERVSGEYVITVLACCRAGAVFAGLSPLLSTAELAELTHRIVPRLALTAAGTAHPGLPAPHTLDLDLPGTPSAEAMAEGGLRSSTGSAEDPALIRATSSTASARPKLVLRPHRAATWICGVDLAPLDATTSCCCTTTALFRPAEVCKAFAAGATLVIPETVGLAGLEAELAAQRVTVIYTTPAVLTALVRQPEPPPADLRLAFIGTIAAALPPAIRLATEMRFGATVFEEYALSECTSITTTLGTTPPEGSIGRPNSGVEIAIFGADDRPVARGFVGELAVRSPGLMLGYIDDPAATAEVMRGGWFYTRDRARQDHEGYFHLTGRRGLLINVGGLKVAPEEVEAVLAQHPAVREVVVTAMPDTLRGEAVRAIIVPGGVTPTIQELRRFCRARLASHKVPRQIEFRQSLPRSALGKVLRHEL